MEEPQKERPIKLFMDYPFIHPDISIRIRLRLLRTEKNKFGHMVDRPTAQVVRNLGEPYVNLSPNFSVCFNLKDETGRFNSQTSLSLSSIGVMLLKDMVFDMVKNMKTRNLYYYAKGELLLNKDVAFSLSRKCPINNRMVTMEYVVVKGRVFGTDNENSVIMPSYEGFRIMIAGISTVADVTYDEGRLLYEALDNLQTPKIMNMIIPLLYQFAITPDAYFDEIPSNDY